MELTLCHRCKSDFESAGKDLRRVSHIQEWCDYCDYRMGYTYREVQRGRTVGNAVLPRQGVGKVQTRVLKVTALHL